MEIGWIKLQKCHLWTHLQLSCKVPNMLNSKIEARTLPVYKFQTSDWKLLGLELICNSVNSLRKIFKCHSLSSLSGAIYLKLQFLWYVIFVPTGLIYSVLFSHFNLFYELYELGQQSPYSIKHCTCGFPL